MDDIIRIIKIVPMRMVRIFMSMRDRLLRLVPASGYYNHLAYKKRLRAFYMLILVTTVYSCLKTSPLHPLGSGGSVDTSFQQETRLFFDTCRIRYLKGDRNLNTICMELREQLEVDVHSNYVSDYMEHSLFSLNCENCLFRELIYQMQRQEPALEFLFYGYNIQLNFKTRPVYLLPNK